MSTDWSAPVQIQFDQTGPCVWVRLGRSMGGSGQAKAPGLQDTVPCLVRTLPVYRQLLQMDKAPSLQVTHELASQSLPLF